MRRGLALGLVVLTAVGAAGAAEGAGSTKRYLRVAATALFYYQLDYGSHPDGVFNGTYEKTIGFDINAIAVYDGGRLSVPSGLMLMEGIVQIQDRMMQRAGEGRRRPSCAKRGRVVDGAREWSTNTAGGVFSGGHVSLSADGVRVDPGQKLVWSIGCAATEQLENHGLPGGPSFTVTAPARARFSGTQVFSFACKDRYSHEADASDPNGHSFDGQVKVFVRFTPFPESRLTDTKKALRDRAGKGLTAAPLPQTFRECV